MKNFFHTLPFDIQFFGQEAQERTEPATPKKRQKTRSKGQVCKSKDLTAAVEILTGLFALLGLGYGIFSGLLGYLRTTIAFMGEEQMFRGGWFETLSFQGISRYFLSWLPTALLVIFFALAVTIKQIGWAFSLEPFELNLGRLNPIAGMKKIISLRSMMELLKGLFKSLIFGIVIYIALRDKLPLAVRAMQLSMEDGALLLWEQLWDLSLRMALMLFIISLVDYGYQKWDFEKSIKMSKQEIKEEHKQTEGDPQIKSKIRQKQRELAKKRMMASVPKADVVITNPTHIAVALLYDRSLMAAPQVVAKGKGIIARKIREIAEENHVPVIENRPLAWALYGGVEIGDEVPADLYRGVAEILAMVYKIKKN